MTKVNRVKRPKAEIQEELKSQLTLLHSFCNSYDSGKEVFAKPIANSLRLLLHHYEKGRSRALLEQLNLRNNRFYDTAICKVGEEISQGSFLFIMKLKVGVGGLYIPASAPEANNTDARPENLPRTKFEDWWKMPVLIDTKGAKFSRREIIGHVANTDGGAHVDPDLEEAYMELSRNNSLGWTFGNGCIEEKFKNRGELACIRQIAYETFFTIADISPQFLPEEYILNNPYSSYNKQKHTDA